jgi:predicted Rossmann-fold nucleotide-binding protein
MIDWIKGELLADGMISDEEFALLHVTDDPDDAVRVVLAHYTQRRARSSRG